MGAVFRVPTCGFDDAPGRRIALVPHGGTPLAAVDLDGPVVFLLGAEREGLPDALRVDARVSIPQAGGAESLNVALAGAIALYERLRR
jgi:tRNA G18 (ribose-2'-O)-methylase SpoU